jgi:glc operon protein GlcG
MKTIKYSFLIVAALASLPLTIFSQQAPNNSQQAPDNSDELAGRIRPMTLEKAKQIVAAAVRVGCKPPSPCNGSYVVADDAGTIIYLETMDGSVPDLPILAQKKAITAARWRMPTRKFQEYVKDQSNIAYMDGSFPNMTLSPGGVPLFDADHKIVGGFGCGGTGCGLGTKITDAAIAEAAKLFARQ